MPTSPPRGLGRGLGELFQRTEPTRADVPTAPSRTSVSAIADAHVPPPPPTESSDASTAEVDVDVDVASSVALVPVPAGSSYAEVPVEAITPNPRQPRSVFDEDALNELVASIGEVGLLQPVVVRPIEGSDSEGPVPGDRRYELVMGERRWRAAQRAGLTVVPAIIRRTEDHDLLRDALLENLHRAQLNPLEEAAAYQQMLDDFGCTQEELAQRIKRSRPQISNTIRLLRLPPTVQRRVAAGVLSAGHARALLVVEDPAAQERLAQRVVAEGLSVRSTEEIVTLGDGDRRSAPRRRQQTAADPATDELAARLSDHLETRVRVDLGRTRGRITIDVASFDDLRRVAEAMGLVDDLSTNT
ncbi:MAG: ParB/RepB/Spo0J family partition protein [Propionibacteriaceae bacterium]